MNLLITGGAGYIGSHVVLAALDQGCHVTVFDNLSTGVEQNINDKTRFVFGSISSKNELLKLFKNNKYDAVIHLAGSKAAGDSMLNPLKYAEDNIMHGLNLINSCVEHGVKIFIFSSSAAVYGKPQYIPIDETHPLKPYNYYGYTKLVIEENLKWFSMLKKIQFASLRYFNAAGYDINNRINGIEINPQNLIPIVMETAIGKRKKVKIYGNDYKTLDGTGVRDYVHVNDLAKAHLNAIDYILKNEKDLTINLGTETGYSVLEIINKTMHKSNKIIGYDFKNRRVGDSDVLISKSSLAKELINWEATYSDLDTIISSTWQVYKKKLSL